MADTFPVAVAQPTSPEFDVGNGDSFQEPPVDAGPAFNEPDFVTPSTMSERGASLLTSQLALINTPVASESDPSVVDNNYIEADQNIKVNGLTSIKEQLADDQTRELKSIFELEAIKGLEDGTLTNDEITLAVQYGMQEANKAKELAIERRFADRMMEMLAADPDNLPIVDAMVSSRGEDSFSTLMDLNERALRLGRIIDEKVTNKEQQSWLLDVHEWIARSFTPGSAWIAMLDVAPKGTGISVPSEVTKAFNKSYYEMSDEEYSNFIETFSGALDTATNIGYSPNEGLQLEILSKLQNPNFTEGMIDNTSLFLDAVDSVLLAVELGTAFRKSGKLSEGTRFMGAPKYKGETLQLFGQRKLGSDIVVRTMDNPNAKGASFENHVNDAVDQSIPSVGRKEQYMGSSNVSATESIVIKANTERFQEIIKAIYKDERLSTDEKVLAIEEAFQGLRHEFGPSHAADVKIDRVSQENGVTRVNMALGTEEGLGFKSKDDALAAIEARKLPVDSEPFLSQDGSWFIKISRDINEKNIFLDIEDVSDSILPWGNYMKSTPSILPTGLMGKANRGGDLKGFYLKQMEPINRTIANLTSRLKGNKLKNVQKVTIEGNYKVKWYNRTEFEAVYKRLNNGEKPSQLEWEAYHAFILKNDIDHAFLNWAEYLNKKQQGYARISGSFSNLTNGRLTARKIESISGTGRMSIYDADTGTAISGKSITINDLNAKLRKGYELYELDNVYGLKDKSSHINHILVKKGDIRHDNLSFFQLPYRPGGHRSPHVNFILKQARTGKFSNGQEYVLNPLTHAGATTETALKEYAGRMNEALKAYQRNQLPITDPKYLDDVGADKIIRKQNVEKGLDGFRKLIDDGLVDPKHPFEVVQKDSNPIPIFGKDTIMDDVVRLDNVSTVTSMIERQGIPYYRGRGAKPLSGPDGEYAKLIDPLRVLEESMSRSIHKGAMANYKFAALTSWMNEFGEAFKNAPGISKMQTFFEKDVLTPDDFTKGHPNKVFIRKAISSHYGIRTTLMSGSNQTAKFEVAIDKTAKFLEGRGLPGMAEGMYGAKDLDPVGELRTWNYDLRLGLGAIDQVFQGFTALTISAMDGPVKGLKYLEWGYLFQTLNFATSDKSLRFVANMMKRTQGIDVAEFEEFVRIGREAGMIELRGDMAALDRAGTKNSNALFTLDDLREKGRGIVMAMERFNKAVGYAKAWSQLRETIPVTQMRQPENLDRLSQLAGKWSLDMSSTSAARFQKGMLAVPTQFFPYTSRLIENVYVGTNKEWTLGERIKMMVTQAVLFGSAGIPFIPGYDASDIMIPILEGMGVDTTDKNVAATIYGGLVDLLLVNTFGATISARAGIGESIDSFGERFFGGDFGITSGFELVGGPAGQMFYTLGSSILAPVGALFTAFKALDGQMAADVTETMVKDVLLENVNGMSDWIKAYYIMRHGVYLSNKGNNTAEVDDALSALSVLLGMTPQAAVEAYRGFRTQLDTKESVKQLAGKVDTHILNYNMALKDYNKTGSKEAMDKMNKSYHTISVLMNDMPEEVKTKIHKKLNNFKSLQETVKEEVFRRWKKYGNEE